jgi:hypothetical protein
MCYRSYNVIALPFSQGAIFLTDGDFEWSPNTLRCFANKSRLHPAPHTLSVAQLEDDDDSEGDGDFIPGEEEVDEDDALEQEMNAAEESEKGGGGAAQEASPKKKARLD